MSFQVRMNKTYTRIHTVMNTLTHLDVVIDDKFTELFSESSDRFCANRTSYFSALQMKMNFLDACEIANELPELGVSVLKGFVPNAALDGIAEGTAQKHLSTALQTPEMESVTC